MKNISLWTQSFSELILWNNIYIDKTKYIFNLIKNIANKGYYISRPSRWGKTLTINILKEVFLWNKELFKWFDIYDLYKEWDNTYPVILISFVEYNTTQNNNLLEYIETQTTIYIDNKEYYINDFIDPKKINNLWFLIREIKKKTNKNVVVLIDEYDSPFIKNLNNEQEFNKIKSFFADFYSSIKAKFDDIRFFYLSGLTKVAQTDLFSAMNHLRDITYSSEYNSFIGYTLEEIKKYFQDFIPLVSKKLNLSEELLFQKLKEWYDWYYFGDSNNTLYNPRSINSFFIEKEFNWYWSKTGSASIVENVFSNPSSINISDFLLKLVNNTLQIRKEALSIDNIKYITPELLLLQSWYLTFSDEWCSTLKIPNMEIRNALYSDFKKYIFL